MIYKYSDLLKKHKSRREVDGLIKKGQYIKISRGIYKNKNDLLDDYVHLCTRYKNITITLQSAAYYYQLTDFVPDKSYVVSLSKGTIIKDQKVSQSFMKDEIFYIGREKVNTDQGYIYIYDKERLLIEIIRLKSKLPYDFYKEVCNSFRDLVKQEKIDLSKIVKYAHQLSTRGDGILKTILEVIL